MEISQTEEPISTLSKLAPAKLSSLKNHRNTVFLLWLSVISILVLFSTTSNTFATPNNILEGGPFVTQSLKGDSVDTWSSWQLEKNDPFHIHIINEANVSSQKIIAVKNALLSKDTIEINDELLHKDRNSSSQFFLGWMGVLDKLSTSEFKYQLPTEFHLHEDTNSGGQIVITLSNDKNVDGYSGLTRSNTDDSQNQILKSHITIYESEKLTNVEMELIVKHEMGHALGLGHSTDPADLMHPEMSDSLPYISECTVNALESLAQGNEISQYVCKK